MKRREFITLFGGAAAAWPVGVSGQPRPTPSIGVLGMFSLGAETIPMIGLRKGLSEIGYNDGQNLKIETRRAAEASFDQLLGLASELVHQGASVLVATGSARVAQAAMAATSTLPIVFANGSDPVKIGLVKSMNHPGGNATGVTFYTSTLGPKRLELLIELVPSAKTIAFLVNPTNPVTDGDVQDLEDAAGSIGRRLIIVRASTANEIDAAFEAIVEHRADAILVNVDAFFSSRSQQIAFLAERHRLPASYNNSLYAKSGGLMSYGDNRLSSYRQVGIYVGRILRGDKPDNLPVMQPTVFDLAINLRAARALGLTVPPTLLARADEVIE